MGFIFFLAFLFLGFYLLKGILSYSEATDNWRHLFADMEYDPEEFYTKVEQILEERQVPDIRIIRRMFKEGGILSHHRVFLEVSRGDYTFHICAAPWGTGFFFSWWVREKLSEIDELLIKIPYIGLAWVKARQRSSYYKLDTDALFRESVINGIMETIDQLTEAKGIRGLTELERKPDLRNIIN